MAKSSDPGLSSVLPSALLGLRNATIGCTVDYDATPYSMALVPGSMVLHTRSSSWLWCSEPPRYWHNTLRANSPSAYLSSLLVTRALTPLRRDSPDGLVAPLPPLICPDPCSWLERNITSPVWGPLLDRVHALWVAFIGPSSGVCSCRMQKTCTKGRLVGSRLSACGDTENRPDQHSEVSSLLH
ncbi:hypothetical protein GGI43DRAFT_285106 [Trichoderma evansii]